MNERRTARQRWATPVFGVAMGLVFLVVFGSKGDWVGGLVCLAIMVGYSLVLVLLGRRSETVALLGGDALDERREQIAAKAVQASAYVLISVIIIAFVVDIARGGDGMPWAALGGLSGLTFMLATAYYRWRS